MCTCLWYIISTSTLQVPVVRVGLLVAAALAFYTSVGSCTSVLVLGVRVECTGLQISSCFLWSSVRIISSSFSFSIHHPSSSFDCRLSAATPRHTVVANSRIGKCAVAVGVRLCCEFCGKMSLKRRTATRGLICALVFGLLSSSVSFASPFSWFVMCMCGHMVFADDCGRDDANSWCLCIMATVVFIFSQYCLSYCMPDSTLLYGTGTNQPRILRSLSHYIVVFH